jgi:hypothetical protein
MTFEDRSRLSRREALARAGLLGAAAALAPLPRVAERYGLLSTASAAADDVAVDTLRGLVAYIVPGDDVYSRAQGQSTGRPGGIAAGAAEGLRATLDVSGAGVADAAVAILNRAAGAVHPGGGTGTFASQFAALAFARKDDVFTQLGGSSDSTLRSLAGILPAIVAFLSYSEVAVLDPRTRGLRGKPVGWELTGYTGVADIRDEFRGYLGGRRSARGSDA